MPRTASTARHPMWVDRSIITSRARRWFDAGVRTGVAAVIAAAVACSDSTTGVPATPPPGDKPPVTPVPVHAVEVTPGALVLDREETRRLDVVVRASNGDRLEGRRLTWHWSDSTVISVSPTGVVTALAPGRATVVVAAESRGATVEVTVRAPVPPPPAPVAEVVLAQGTLALETAEYVQLFAETRDAQGNVLAGRAVSFTSSDPAIVEATSGGSLRAVAPGVASITATSEGRQATATVRVHARPAYDLLYDRVATSGNEIFTLSLQGPAMPVRINAGNVSRHASPSPDGSRLVFAVTQPDPLTGVMMHDLFVVDRTGLNIRHLTRMSGVETTPSWSPDGTRIAFAGTEGDAGYRDIYVVNVDGSGVVNLTPNTSLSYEDHPAWSPDSRTIAFTSLPPIGGSQLHTVRADGSAAPVQVALAPLLNPSHPTWSPDGERLAFSATFAGEMDIAIVPVAGGAPMRVSVPGVQAEPVWSPDGTHFAYSGPVNGIAQLFTMRVDGSMVRLRTDSPLWGGGRSPAWIARH